MQKYVETFANNLGRPVVGGSVAVYTYPANVLAVIYSDNGVTPKTNPTTTDANGLFSFYAADGHYSLYLTSDDTVPLTVPDAVLLEDPLDGNPLVASSLTVTGIATMLANSASPALKVTQTGSGPALLVEDSASTDSTPFVVDANGRVIAGHTAAVTGVGANTSLVQSHSISAFSTGYNSYQWSSDTAPAQYQALKSRGVTAGTRAVVNSGDEIVRMSFAGDDGTNFITSATISAFVDGTPGTNDMPGRLVFSTTPDGSATPVERMRIDNAGQVGIGGAASAGTSLRLPKNLTGSNFCIGMLSDGAVQSDATARADYFLTSVTAAAGAYSAVNHYRAQQGTLTGTVANQKGFEASSTLTGATNNYGFYGDIAAAAGRWNFYANGTAANFFAGDMQLGKTVTAGGTTGAQTINKTAGTVNFAAAATTLVVTNNLVTTSSIVLCTIGTADATMKSVVAVAGAGSFTLTANAAATAETRVNFAVFN